jgi:hypothetical protein
MKFLKLPIEPKTKLGRLVSSRLSSLLCGDSTDEATVARLMDGSKVRYGFD